MKMIYLLSLLTLLYSGILSQNPLDKAGQFDPRLQDILEHEDQYEIQIIYTQIDRDQNGHPTFTSFERGLDSFRYYYPASTVKMPIAALALEKQNELKIEELKAKSPMQNHVGRPIQTADFLDAASASGFQTIDHYVKQIFLVSDNNAFNRLYEWLGQAYIFDRLQEKGFDQSRIIHRLSVSGFDTLENQYTNPVSFYDQHKGELLYHKGLVKSRADHDELTQKVSNTIKGKGYYNSSLDSVLSEPFDFTYKNFISLADLHDILKTIIFPEAAPPHQRFNIADEDYRRMLKYMGMRPRESQHPAYDSTYTDSYVKFFMYGTDSANMPDGVRILNKVGWAYGYLTDVAYVIDMDHKIEFILAATIHVNDNQIYNDGKYEYEKTGLPFFDLLGSYIYDYERQRKKKYAPAMDNYRQLFQSME